MIVHTFYGYRLLYITALASDAHSHSLLLLVAEAARNNRPAQAAYDDGQYSISTVLNYSEELASRTSSKLSVNLPKYLVPPIDQLESLFTDLFLLSLYSPDRVSICSNIMDI